jgi:hypothetical protein
MRERRVAACCAQAVPPIIAGANAICVAWIFWSHRPRIIAQSDRAKAVPVTTVRRSSLLWTSTKRMPTRARTNANAQRAFARSAWVTETSFLSTLTTSLQNVRCRRMRANVAKIVMRQAKNIVFWLRTYSGLSLGVRKAKSPSPTRTISIITFSQRSSRAAFCLLALRSFLAVICVGWSEFMLTVTC